MRKLFYSPWQTLGVPFVLTPISQLHQSLPLPIFCAGPESVRGLNLRRGRIWARCGSGVTLDLDSRKIRKNLQSGGERNL